MARKDHLKLFNWSLDYKSKGKQMTEEIAQDSEVLEDNQVVMEEPPVVQPEVLEEPVVLEPESLIEVRLFIPACKRPQVSINDGDYRVLPYACREARIKVPSLDRLKIKVKTETKTYTRIFDGSYGPFLADTVSIRKI